MTATDNFAAQFLSSINPTAFNKVRKSSTGQHYDVSGSGESSDTSVNKTSNKDSSNITSKSHS